MRSDELTRRTFLAAGGAVVTGALVGCGGGGFAPVAGDVQPTLEIPDTPLEEALDDAREADPTLAFLTRHDFDRWHGESFDVTNADGETMTVELATVTDRSDTMNEAVRELGLREPFSVQFHGPLDGFEEPGLHRINHPDMGEIRAQVMHQGTSEDGGVRVYELFFA